MKTDTEIVCGGIEEPPTYLLVEGAEDYYVHKHPYKHGNGTDPSIIDQFHVHDAYYNDDHDPSDHKEIFT